MARRLPSFDGEFLDEFLAENYEADGDIDAVAHLYEAIPGTTLPRLARTDSETLGQSAGPWAFHPLTREAASVLFAEPGLAPETQHEAGDRLNLDVGERFYFLEVRGTPTQPRGIAGGRPVMRRPSHVRLAIQPLRSRAVMRLYLSETRVQELARRINRGETTSAAGDLFQLATRQLDRLFAGQGARRLRFGGQGATLAARRAVGRRLAQQAAVVRPLQLGAAFSGWLAKAIGASAVFAQDLAKAAADQRMGATVIAEFDGIGGLQQLAGLIRGTAASTPPPSLTAPNSSTIRVVAGYMR
jgi:hypothetical protein